MRRTPLATASRPSRGVGVNAEARGHCPGFRKAPGLADWLPFHAAFGRDAPEVTAHQASSRIPPLGCHDPSGGDEPCIVRRGRCKRRSGGAIWVRQSLCAPYGLWSVRGYACQESCFVRQESHADHALLRYLAITTRRTAERMSRAELLLTGDGGTTTATGFVKRFDR